MPMERTELQHNQQEEFILMWNSRATYNYNKHFNAFSFA